MKNLQETVEAGEFGGHIMYRIRQGYREQLLQEEQQP